MKFTGDDTSNDATITKKNGETLTIYGGVAAKDADGKSLLTDVNNVGVVKLMMAYRLNWLKTYPVSTAFALVVPKLMKAFTSQTRRLLIQKTAKTEKL